MKFAAAWSNILSQNLTLRLVIMTLGSTTLVLAVTSVKLMLKEPLIIERGCLSFVQPTVNSKHPVSEIDAFVRTALSKRFDTSAQDTDAFLADDERGFRTQEQTELAKKQVTERVLVNAIKVDGTNVTVDADRLLSVGKIRSALPFVLKVEIATQSRTPSNPYGLLLKKVSALKEDDK
jgi:hypothetical protein